MSVSVFTENVAIFLAAAQKTNIPDILTQIVVEYFKLAHT